MVAEVLVLEFFFLWRSSFAWLFLYAPDFTVDAHKTTLFSDVVSLYCFLMSKSILWCVLTHRFLGSCSPLSTGKICDFRKLLTVKGYCFRVRSRQRGRLALMRWNAPSQQCYSSFKRKPLKSFRNTWLENTPENVPHNLRKLCPFVIRKAPCDWKAVWDFLDWAHKRRIQFCYHRSILLLSSCCYHPVVMTSIWRQLSGGYWVRSQYPSARILEHRSPKCLTQHQATMS